jgi:tetratricopeptide (TPR) repeat protein
MSLSFPTPENRVDATLAFNAGVQAMQQGDDATAIAHWQRAAELDVTLVPAVHNLIVYHEDREQFEKVAELYALLLDLNPYDTRSLIRQAAALRRLGRLAPAISNYERAIGIYPWFRHWYQELANLLDQADQHGAAEEWRARAGQLDTEEAEMACEDGTRQLRKGNLPLAIACFEAVLEDYPSNNDVRVKLAQALEHSGDTAGALAHYAICLEHAGDTPALVHFHRARTLLALGRDHEAATDLQIALDHAPGFGRARFLLAQIDLTHSETPTLPPGTVAPIANQAPRRTSAGTAAQQVARRLAPWEEPLMDLLRQVAARPAPLGGPVRFAVVVEPHASLAPVAMRLADMFQALELPVESGYVLPVLVVESEARPGEGMVGVNRAGWLGSDALPDVRVMGWNPVTSGLPLDQALSAVANTHPDGFNAIVVLGTGRARGDQPSLARVVRSIACPLYIHLAPPGNPGETAARLQPLAQAWSEFLVD